MMSYFVSFMFIVATHRISAQMTVVRPFLVHLFCVLDSGLMAQCRFDKLIKLAHFLRYRILGFVFVSCLI